jgi:hypothetical protein
MKTTSRFIRLTALLIAAVMMMSLCLVSCDDGESGEVTTPADGTTAPVADSTQPSYDTTAPGADTTTSPSGDATTPAPETTVPAPESTQSPDDKPETPVVDVNTAAGVAALFNANLADLIPVRDEEDTTDIVAAIGEMISSVLAATSQINLSVDNVKLTTAEGEEVLVDKLAIKDNCVYMLTRGEYGSYVKVMKLTANGLVTVESVDNESYITTESFGIEKLASVFDESAAIDFAALKTALTFEESDFVKKEDGVWEVKAASIVATLNDVIKVLNMGEDSAELKPTLDALFNMSLVINLKEYNTNEAVEISLNIPDAISANIKSDSDSFDMTVEIPASAMKLTVASACTDSGFSFDADLSVSGISFAALDIKNTKADDGSKFELDFAMMTGEVDALGAPVVLTATADVTLTATQLTVNGGVSVGGVSLIAVEIIANIIDDGRAIDSYGYVMVEDQRVNFSLKAGISADGTTLDAEGSVFLNDQSLFSFVINAGVSNNGNTVTVEAKFKVGQEKFDFNFNASVSESGDSITVSGDIKAGAETFSYSFVVTLLDAGKSIMVNGELSYGQEKVRIDARVDMIENAFGVTADITADGVVTKIIMKVDLAPARDNAILLANLHISQGAGENMAVVANLALEISAIDANANKYKIVISNMDAELLSFEIGIGTADFTLTDTEAALLAKGEAFFKNYASYAAQLSIYEEKVYAAYAAGKLTVDDFIIIDTADPQVIYCFVILDDGEGNFELETCVCVETDTSYYVVLTEADITI